MQLKRSPLRKRREFVCSGVVLAVVILAVVVMVGILYRPMVVDGWLVAAVYEIPKCTLTAVIDT